MVRENGSDTYHYVYKDHLGSILAVTDAGGNVEAEQNFDAWGRRRNVNTWTYTSVGTVPDWLYRGYTGHEMLDPFVLINMNGRIYDPVVGRVLSPDNYVQDAFSTQDFNRYSYANNNPLKYTDPDGNTPLLGAILGGLGYFFSIALSDGGFKNWDFGQFFGSVAIGAITGGIAEGLGAATSSFGSVGSGAFTGAISGAIAGGFSSGIGGGNFGQGAWQGGLFGGALGALGGALAVDETLLAYNEDPTKTIDGGRLPQVAWPTVKANRLLNPSNYYGQQVRATYLALLASGYFDYINNRKAPPSPGTIDPHLGFYGAFIPIFPKGTFAIPRLGAGSIREGSELASKNFNKITDNLLKKSGIDAHQIKRDFLGAKARISQYDLYKHTQTGEILILQKGGKGLPIPTGEFLK